MVKAQLDEHIGTLIQRSSLFRCLVEEPQRRSLLVTQVDASRSTVYRALEKLQSQGLVASSGSGYHPTPYGKLLFHALEELRQYAGTIHGSDPFLRALPEEIPVAYELVAAGELVESSRAEPRAPLTSLCEFIDEATRLKAAANVVYPENAEAYYRNVTDGSTECTLILPDDLARQIHTEYRDEFQTVIQSPTATLLTTSEPLPFTLLISEAPDRRVCVALHDECGTVQAVVLNGSTAVYEWAIGVFRAFERHDTTGAVAERRPDDESTDGVLVHPD